MLLPMCAVFFAGAIGLSVLAVSKGTTPAGRV